MPQCKRYDQVTLGALVVSATMLVAVTAQAGPALRHVVAAPAIETATIALPRTAERLFRVSENGTWTNGNFTGRDDETDYAGGNEVTEPPRETQLPPTQFAGGDSETEYLDPVPRRPQILAGGFSAATEQMRGGPETLRTHRRMGIFR